MGSRLYPLSLALGALLADAAGLHHVAFYLVLLAVPGAAASAFVAASDALEGRPAWPRAASTALSLALLVLGSAVRGNAPEGAAVPHLATSAVVAAVLVYALALVAWLAEPVRWRLRDRPAHVRVEAATDP
ncbi:MAG: hypothetical protein V7644_1823 [Actinomycetota bacterium]|jgi:hypothetical protein